MTESLLAAQQASRLLRTRGSGSPLTLSQTMGSLCVWNSWMLRWKRDTHLLHELEVFGEEVAGVDEKDGDVGFNLGGEVDGAEGIGAEGACHHKAFAEGFVGPADDVEGVGFVEAGVEGAEFIRKLKGRSWGGGGHGVSILKRSRWIRDHYSAAVQTFS